LGSLERDPAVLDQQDDEQAHQDGRERGSGRSPDRGELRPQHLAERERAGRAGEHEQGQEQRRLGEAREGDLARPAHALEGRAGVERRGDREEAPERERIGEEDEVSRKAQRRRVATERNEQSREQRRDLADDRAGA
jgi:hypothetical protein